MRLAILGPADGNRAALRSRAQSALDSLNPDRIVYLGVDGIFDEVLRAWALELVQEDPSDDAVWDRALRTCVAADHQTLDKFLLRERKRAKLRTITCLPHATARTVELFSGIVTILIHDKANLDEEERIMAIFLGTQQRV